jgi:enamine deaminase RidA (YjgF/YER057c/UK114 family)
VETRVRILLAGLFLSSFGVQAQVRAVVPSSVPVNHFYSPGVDAGDYIYVSGQGPRRADGTIPPTFEAQVRQALDNVRSVVETAGLTMDHVVYMQVYLEDIDKCGDMDRIFAEVFPIGKTPPARAVLGVAKLPEPGVQINAVAVRDLRDRQAVYPPNYKSKETYSPGLLTHERLFVSAMPGTRPCNRQGA